MRFWLNHAVFPLIAFCMMLFIFNITELDLSISDIFFNHALHKWSYGESWWSVTLIHIWGKDLIAAIFIASLLGFGLSFFVKRFETFRFVCAYIAMTIFIATVIVALLKQYSNVDCPWDLQFFNGVKPYYHIFSHKPSNFVAGKCYPGGHSSGGFSLLLLYFLFLDYKKSYAYMGLGIGLTMGAIFGFGQLVRGAHFVSHDMTSAMICWLIALVLYKIFMYSRMERFLARNPSNA